MPDPVTLIEHKRDGGAHDAETLRWLVRGVVDETVPDYQLAAWLMAVVWHGMTDRETADLTLAMAESGTVLDLSDLPGPVVDKHSTGGVGDKTSLIVGPLAAATGLTVAKMSGRGLGFTGGTLDKLESIPDLSIDLSIDAFRRQAAEVGLVIAGQTGDLAPADKRLYALRDVTGTVPSEPLIAASIMSKKIAAGASGIALDVKVGRGAFMRQRDDARALAETMVRLGVAADRRVAAALTAMDQPLGRAVGNAIEVREAIATLQGDGPADLIELCLTVAGLMHVVAGRADHPDDVRADLEDALDSGASLDKLRQMIEAQGGDPHVVDDPDRLPSAPEQQTLCAESDGIVTTVDALTIGRAAVALGAGRKAKGEPVDPAVGIVLAAKVGDRVARGDPLATLHTRGGDGAAQAAARVRDAFSISDDAIELPAVVHELILDGAAPQ